MAQVIFTAQVNLQDEHSLTGSKTLKVYVDDAVYTTPETRFGIAHDAIEAFVAALDDIIDPVITGVTITSPVTVGGLKSVAGDQGVAEGAQLTLETEDTLAVAQERPYFLPGANASTFLANFRQVDIGDANLLSWIATFVLNAACRILISDGEEVTGIASGRYATKRRDSNA